jgi:lipoyl(octanoyl) transferase
MRQWRLIYDNPAPGAWNMAVDEAILESVGSDFQVPTLRLYAWNPPCLSLGYGQHSSDVDFERCQQLGWDVVRRPSGGRAILHIDELTYSLALPADDELTAGSVVESYWRISTALIRGLTRLGANPVAEARSKQPENGPTCFETPSHYEITVNGRKLVGSAQMRRKGGVLQHGTLPLSGDIARICDGLIFPHVKAREMAKEQVRERALTLTDALGRNLSWEQVAEAVVNGFQEAFDVDFGNGATRLTESEYLRAYQLCTQIYASEQWTRRR